MTPYQEFIHRSRYARFLPDEQRRETWTETVSRYVEYISQRAKNAALDKSVIHAAIYNMDVMPSMRLLMSAGAACDNDNLAAYNCAYAAINRKRRFAEILYVLMNGTGVGFSCERQEIAHLPEVPHVLVTTDDVIVVADSKLGWAKAYARYVSALYDGDVPSVDYSHIRPAGARLKTFGGRASGPAPLRRLFDYTLALFRGAAGRRLTSIEVHDLVCMIGDVVVVGGVRRSALLSLSNLSDLRMRDAKAGAWWESHKHRALANNSVAYTETPDVEVFTEEWLALMRSKSGERGVFNRVAAQAQAARWGRRPADIAYGCNPCSEIILRDAGLCNLTEIVVRPHDTLDDLTRKVWLATVLGTLQSTLTDFNFVSEEWKKNAEEERLLGVSLTGVMDHPLLSVTGDDAAGWLRALRDTARETNAEWSFTLGIRESAAITCVKPSGTVAQLTNAGTGGLHPRYAPYYIRAVRQDDKDPITQFLKDAGVRHEPAAGYEGTTTIFYFPQQSPEGAVFRSDRSAVEQLEHWLMFQREWCEHKPSVTVYVKDNEWLEVGGWVYKNFDEMSGVSFLPYDNGTYQQAPFTECSKAEWEIAMTSTPAIDWSLFVEGDDNTTGSQEYACAAGGCTL